MKSFWVLLAVTVLSGCMSGPRPFDGTLGYQVSKNKQGTSVKYTSESGQKPAAVHALVKKVCSSELGVDVDHISLVNEKVDEKEINTEVFAHTVFSPSPVGITNPSRAGGVPGQIVNTRVEYQSVTRPMKLQILSAECVLAVNR